MCIRWVYLPVQLWQCHEIFFSNVDKQVMSCNDKDFSRWFHRFFLLVRWMFHLIGFTSVKRNLFSVEKRATKSVSTKHLWFDGKKKWISTSTFVPFLRNKSVWKEKFTLFISNIKWMILLKMIEMFYALFHDKEFDSWKIPSNSKMKGRSFVCQSLNQWNWENPVRWKKKIGLCSRLIIGVITSLHWPFIFPENWWTLFNDILHKKKGIKRPSGLFIYRFMGHKSTKTCRFSDIGGEPLRRRTPIQGFENEPLVSLDEAIKSLIGRLNIWFTPFKAKTFTKKTV